MITFLLCRQVNAAGKDASEDDMEKIELECVRDFLQFVILHGVGDCFHNLGPLFI